MALAEELRSLAHLLARLSVKKPEQATFRRAISTAYYALFHLLLSDCVVHVVPQAPADLAPRIARSLVHSEMREVCQSIANSNPSTILRSLQPAGFSGELKRVAKAFVELQDARQRADYDISAIYAGSNVLEVLARVDEAFLAWRSIRKSEEATVFLAALLFAKRWSK